MPAGWLSGAVPFPNCFLSQFLVGVTEAIFKRKRVTDLTNYHAIRFLTVENGSGTNISYDEYQVFICPEPMSGRQQVYNAFAVQRTQGQIIVIGRELPYRKALAIATGNAIVERSRKTSIKRYDCSHSQA